MIEDLARGIDRARGSGEGWKGGRPCEEDRTAEVNDCRAGGRRVEDPPVQPVIQSSNLSNAQSHVLGKLQSVTRRSARLGEESGGERRAHDTIWLIHHG